MIRVLAAVRDLFFVARIGETARLVGTQVAFARSPAEAGAALDGPPPDLLIVDLTTPGWDYEVLFGAVEARAPRVPVLGFTTHALARQTQPLHSRCSRVVTKETLTQELGEVLRQGHPGGRPQVPATSPAGPGTPG
jgi:CheY-like chemotaxis protein